MVETVVKIDGMMCGMCESHICEHIRRNFKVRKVSASHRTGQVVVLSEEPLSIELLKEKINEIGYTVLDVKSGLSQKKKTVLEGISSFVKSIFL